MALDLEVDDERARRGGQPGRRPARIRPQFGSPPCSARLHERRVRDRARDRLDRARRAPRTTSAADALGALAVGDDLERELAQQRVERLAEGAARRRSGLDRDAGRAARDHEHRVVGGELAVHARCGRTSASRSTPVSRSSVVGVERGVGLARSRASWRSRGEIIPAPLAWAREAHRPRRQRHLEAGALGPRGRWSGSPREKRAPPSAAELARSAPRDAATRPARAGARRRSRRSRPRRPAPARRRAPRPPPPAIASAISQPALPVADVRVAAVRRRPRAGASSVGLAATRSPARRRRALRREERGRGRRRLVADQHADVEAPRGLDARRRRRRRGSRAGSSPGRARVDAAGALHPARAEEGRQSARRSLAGPPSRQARASGSGSAPPGRRRPSRGCRSRRSTSTRPSADRRSRGSGRGSCRARRARRAARRPAR